MYYPTGAEETLADIADIRGAPKSINHSATRLSKTTTASAEVLQASRDAAERLQTQEIWRDMAKATPALFPNGRVPTDAGGGATPLGFVPSTPSLQPHTDIDPSELMTWGMIEGTPLLLDSGTGDYGSSDKHSFKIPPTPRRDALGHRLAESASKSLRERSQQGKKGSSFGTGKSSGLNRLDNTPGSSWSVPSPRLKREPSPALLRSQMLSPAAQRLLASKGLRSAMPGRGVGVDVQLRASYSASSPRRLKTPLSGATPALQSSLSRSSSTPTSKTSNKMNPQSNKSDSSATQPNSDNSSSITDNLLNF